MTVSLQNTQQANASGIGMIGSILYWTEPKKKKLDNRNIFKIAFKHVR